eukprot:m.1081 g.1081  ORF g.1081 m.1081 type:complete len:131 (-) comp889_c0_seq1:202-594(-)
MYRHNMITTKELRCYTAKNPPQVVLGREQHVQEKYNEFSRTPTNGKEFINNVQKILEQQEYHFIQNDFPYFVEPNVQHMVCWYKNSDCETIMKKITQTYEVVTFWENLAHNKSIKEISHIHVFVIKQNKL